MSDRMTAQQLKTSIIQLAVQGKLVPQDPNDEPASVLLERIRKEKERLVKEGKINKSKNESYIYRGSDDLHYEKVGNKEPICIEDDLPFEIPDNWEWERLSYICTKLVDGDHNPPKGESQVTPYIMASSTNINNDTLVNLNRVRYLSETVFNKENERTQVNEGDIFFTSVGSLGRSCVYTGGFNICFQRSVSIITTLIYNYYLKFYFDSGYIQQKITAEATGTAQKGFYLNQMARILVPIPPLTEQKRIVDKIQKIEPLIDKYKVIEEQLYDLNSSIKENLKKSIIQYAIEGKLVPQDSNDEPASVLLEKINIEKQKLVQEGKIKKNKHEAVIYRRDNSYYEKVDGVEQCIDDEIPFDIPDNWAWTRLGNLVSYQNGYAYKKSDYSPKGKGIPVIKSNNLMTLNVIINPKTNYIEHPTEKMKESMIEDNDLLMCLSSQSQNTEPLGKTAIYKLGKPALLNQRVLKMKSYNKDLIEWLYYSINSEYFHSIVSQKSGGSAQANLKLEHVLTMLIPIPPIEEQKRIINIIKCVYSKIEIL